MCQKSIRGWNKVVHSSGYLSRRLVKREQANVKQESTIESYHSKKLDSEMRKMKLEMFYGISFKSTFSLGKIWDLQILIIKYGTARIVSAAFSSYVPALASKFRTKNAHVNVDEIDTCTENLNDRIALKNNLKMTRSRSLDLSRIHSNVELQTSNLIVKFKFQSLIRSNSTLLRQNLTKCELALTNLVIKGHFLVRTCNFWSNSDFLVTTFLELKYGEIRPV